MKFAVDVTQIRDADHSIERLWCSVDECTVRQLKSSSDHSLRYQVSL